MEFIDKKTGAELCAKLVELGKLTAEESERAQQSHPDVIMSAFREQFIIKCPSKDHRVLDIIAKAAVEQGIIYRPDTREIMLRALYSQTIVGNPFVGLIKNDGTSYDNFSAIEPLSDIQKAKGIEAMEQFVQHDTIEIIKLKLGFYGTKPMSFKKLGLRFSLSTTEAKKLFYDALDKAYTAEGNGIMKDFVVSEREYRSMLSFLLEWKHVLARNTCVQDFMTELRRYLLDKKEDDLVNRYAAILVQMLDLDEVRIPRFW